MANTKSELDKEIMYRKIMPTRTRAVRNDPPTSPGAENKGRTAEAVTDTIQAVASPQSSGSVNRTSAANRQIREKQDMILVNAMEDLVLSKLEHTIARFNCCKCNKCKKDVAAIALNRLPPRYMVMKDDNEEKLRQVEEEYGAAITSALVQAILVVKKSPRH